MMSAPVPICVSATSVPKRWAIPSVECNAIAFHTTWIRSSATSLARRNSAAASAPSTSNRWSPWA
ncbi:Uncharacterised protein [Mycobacteroides abscessus subsp. abscessus]|nr:Uncharacterised protein [Mycobacteroides abscessus subsp. abscessus]